MGIDHPRSHARGPEGEKSLNHEFAEDRDWEQFHSPKNLSMALSVEAGELVEKFQWLPSTVAEGQLMKFQTEEDPR